MVEEYKYLGVTVSSTGDLFGKHKRSKELGMLRMLGMLKSVSNKIADSYSMIRELWKGVGVPRSLYGYEVFKVNKEEMDRMEKIQNKIARLALGGNKYTAVEALRGEMGWSRYHERIVKMKANYKLRLEQMGQRNEGSWAAYIYRVVGLDWVKEINRIDRKYLLRDLYFEENGRKLVEDAICLFGQTEWERGLNTKSTLRFYGNKERPMMEEYYDGSYQGKLLYRARSGSLEVNGRTYRWNGGRENCQNCVEMVKETIEHVIIECDRYEVERRDLMQEILNQVGQER